MAKAYGGEESVEAYEKRMKEIRKDLYHQEHEKNRLGEELDNLDVLSDDYDSDYERIQGETDTVETWISAEGKPDEEIAFVLDCNEVRVTVAEAKATYAEIRAYVLEHTGMKVSSLYIAQIKRKYGIDIGVVRQIR